MRWFNVVEHEGLPYVGFGFGLFEFGDFGDDLVALVVAVRAGGGDSGQLREELDEAAMAREERLVDGGDHVFCWRFPPVALAVMVVAFPTVSDGLRWGPLGDLHHSTKYYYIIFIFIYFKNIILLFFNNGTRGKMMALGFFLRPSWPLKF
jgi:hypothetical protein